MSLRYYCAPRNAGQVKCASKAISYAIVDVADGMYFESWLLVTAPAARNLYVPATGCSDISVTGAWQLQDVNDVLERLVLAHDRKVENVRELKSAVTCVGSAVYKPLDAVSHTHLSRTIVSPKPAVHLKEINASVWIAFGLVNATGCRL